MILAPQPMVRSLHAASLARCSRWPVRLPPCSQPVPKRHRQRRARRAGHRPDGIADVVPVERLVHGKFSRPRRLPQPGRVSRGDPVRARRHQSHLPGHAALRHLLAVGRDGLRRHHDLRPRGVRPAVGPVGRRHLGHRADRPERIDRRPVDAGPRWASSTRPAKQYNWGLFAQTFFSFAGKDGAPDIGLDQPPAIFSYQLGDGRSLSLGNSALVYDTEKSRWASLNLGVNYGQVVSIRRAQVAPEHRGRLRLQGRLRQSEVDDPGEHRAAAAHPLR